MLSSRAASLALLMKLGFFPSTFKRTTSTSSHTGISILIISFTRKGMYTNLKRRYRANFKFQGYYWPRTHENMQMQDQKYSGHSHTKALLTCGPSRKTLNWSIQPFTKP